MIGPIIKKAHRCNNNLKYKIHNSEVGQLIKPKLNRISSLNPRIVTNRNQNKITINIQVLTNPSKKFTLHQSVTIIYKNKIPHLISKALVNKINQRYSRLSRNRETVYKITTIFLKLDKLLNINRHLVKSL